ncbi:helix-turn-helix domain-containing protein [Streptacidiphilus monticola]|uniref:Helix-turn-helix domain-containing protein n=1 Tax=Streptacidiphilus monticola TaxID=2161674 RepID=A0ABW1G6F1_9ACTN
MTYWAALPDDLGPAHRQLVTRLRALKDEHRLTYQQMGRLTHYSHASWERWLNGKRLVTHAALTSLLAATHGDEDLLRLHAIATGAQPAPTPPEAPAAAGSPEPTIRSRIPEARAVTTSGAAQPPPKPAVAQLPPALAGFAGRAQELQALRAALVAEWARRPLPSSWPAASHRASPTATSSPTSAAPTSRPATRTTS